MNGKLLHEREVCRVSPRGHANMEGARPLEVLCCFIDDAYCNWSCEVTYVPFFSIDVCDLTLQV